MVNITHKSDDERRLEFRVKQMYGIATEVFGDENVSIQNKTCVIIKNEGATDLDNLIAITILPGYEKMWVNMSEYKDQAIKLAETYKEQDLGDFEVKLDY